MPRGTPCRPRRPVKKDSSSHAAEFDVILSDMRMPGMSGLDVLRKLREQRVDSSFIVMTGFGTVETAVEAMKLGAVDFVQKPFFRDELLMRVRAAAERRQLARQVDLLQRQIRPDRLARRRSSGESRAMTKVKRRHPARRRRAGHGADHRRDRHRQGTGGARHSCRQLPRAERPFVALNCAALTESLLENELFGHAQRRVHGRGRRRAPGSSSMPSGGTLFLDEIGTHVEGAPGEAAAGARIG